MTVVKNSFRISTKGNCDVIDISGKVRDIVSDSGLSSGNVTVFVPGSTAAITTIEYESGAVEDLRKSLERLIPEKMEYKHNERWGDGNGHSHIRASWIGPSLVVPFYESKLLLGTWQNIVFADLDNRAREREIILLITGE